MGHPDERPVGRKVRVVKLGGSLLQRSDTQDRIQRWVQSLDTTDWIQVWVVGGGEWVELIREFDRQHRLTADQSHAASIAAMEVTARLVSGWFPEWQVVDSVQELTTTIERSGDNQRGRNSSERDPLTWNHLIWYPLASLSRGELDLPASWDVTSDSIAAWLAGRVNADELVLLKSCHRESNQPLDWIQAGLVDRWFGQVCHGGFSIRWVNLTA